MRQWKADHEMQVEAAAILTSGKKVVPIIIEGPIGDQLTPRAAIMDRASLLLAASTGRVVICVPYGNSVEKNGAMRAFGAELIEFGRDFDEARLHAQQLASQHRLEFVNSFNSDLVLGVSTIGHELFSAVGNLDVVYVPIGMGSSICGMIMVRDLLGLKTEIVGVQAAGAPSYWHSFQEQRVVTTEQAITKADGLATRMPDLQAVAIINKGASRVVLVDDASIAEAIRIYYTDTHNLAEGAGAASLAAAMQERHQHSGKRIGLVLSGGNIDLEVFKSWVINPSCP